MPTGTVFCSECVYNESGECHRHAPHPVPYVFMEGEDVDSPLPYAYRWPEAIDGETCGEGKEKK